MLTWTKTDTGYTAATPNGVYTVARTPGHRFALTLNGNPTNHKPGTLAAAKEAAEAVERSLPTGPNPHARPAAECGRCGQTVPSYCTDPNCPPADPGANWPPDIDEDEDTIPEPTPVAPAEPPLPADEGDPPGDPGAAAPDRMFSRVPPRYKDGREVYSWLAG